MAVAVVPVKPHPTLPDTVRRTVSGQKLNESQGATGLRGWSSAVRTPLGGDNALVDDSKP